MNPDQHKDEAHLQDMADQRREWPKLHQDGMTEWEPAFKQVADLKSRLLLKQGEVDYLEDKCKWLQNELDRERNAGWRKG